MRDMKPLPDRDPARTKLAASIAMEAGARRDLQVASNAAGLAERRHWDAQSKIDELRKVVAAPSGALAQLHWVGRRGQSVRDRGVGTFCD